MIEAFLATIGVILAIAVSVVAVFLFLMFVGGIAIFLGYGKTSSDEESSV